MPAGAIQWVGPSGGAWTDKANWAGDAVPSTNQDACWASGITVVLPATYMDEHYVHSITGGSLEIDGGALNLGTASSVDSLIVTGGGIEGNGQTRLS